MSAKNHVKILYEKQGFAMENNPKMRAENRDAVPALLEGLGLKLMPLPISAAIPAAKAFAIYLDRLKKEGRKPENRVPLPDFLIGAHAKADGMKLVTRNPDRVKTYFAEVQLVHP